MAINKFVSTNDASIEKVGNKERYFRVDSLVRSFYSDFGYSLDAGGKGFGQAFTGQAKTLTSVTFLMRKAGSPTGNAYAKLYTTTGTYGTGAIPDTLLATSDAKDVTSILVNDGNVYMVRFDFSGANQYSIETSVKYIITVEYADGSAFHSLVVGGNDGDEHNGNSSIYDGESWTAGNAGEDLIFYINQNVIKKISGQAV